MNNYKKPDPIREVSNDELMRTIRGRIITRMERLEEMLRLVEERLRTTLQEGLSSSQKTRDYTWALGVLIDKGIALSREARELVTDDDDEHSFDDTWHTSKA